MKRTTPKKKLQLARTTLRDLSEDEALTARGGATGGA